MPYSKNKCSCCSGSSSSSGSISGSGSRPSSRSDSRSKSDSGSFSDSSSSSSSSSSVGRCCSIPEKYVVIEETYGPTEFEDMKDWVRSQREGRDGVGLIFVGPVELRNGEWYGAVICMGNESGGGCDCADIEDGWQCTDGIDALSCYLDAGVPGTGIFEEGGNCEEDEDNPVCRNPFEDCEVGCNGCNCCAAEAPPPGDDGVACSRYRRVVPWNVLSYHYGEYIHDPNCQSGKMRDLFEYLGTRGFDPDELGIATFRTNSDPKDCKVEIWTIPPADAGCSPVGAGCPDVCFDGDEDPAWPGITAVPCCPQEGCPPNRCYTADDIGVDVMDGWQAGQIGGEWTNITGDSCTGGPCSVCWDCEWWEVDFAGRVCLSKDGERFQDGIYKEQSYSYATINEKEEITLPDDCQIIDEWVNEGGYDQYPRWRWARVDLIENYWQNDPDWATEAKHYDSRVWTQNELQLWVCQRDGKWSDRTADMIVNPECLKSDPDIFCEGWRVADDGTIEECDSNIYDDPAEGLAYWTEVAEVPTFDSLTDCDESFEYFPCPNDGRKREVNPLP